MTRREQARAALAALAGDGPFAGADPLGEYCDTCQWHGHGCAALSRRARMLCLRQRAEGKLDWLDRLAAVPS